MTQPPRRGRGHPPFAMMHETVGGHRRILSNLLAVLNCSISELFHFRPKRRIRAPSPGDRL